MKKTILLFVIFFSFYANAQNYSIIDSHLHFLDFTQDTDGFPRVIQAMDSANVEKAIVFGMPMVKMWSENDPIRPEYYLNTDSRAYYYSATDFLLAERLLRENEETQKRFYPFISGINPLDLNSAQFIETLLELYPNFWKGIGEIISRHDDLTAFLYGEFPRANHPALMKVYQLAAKHDLPILIHHDITSVSYNNPIYLKEFEDAVYRNPKTIFIWAHAGTSRRIGIDKHILTLKRLLNEYPNLFIDISWVLFDEHIKMDMDNWVSFIEEFPDRFSLGSDNVANTKTYVKDVSKYQPLLKRLKPKTRELVSKGNIERILEE
ncbi:amidohydrolase family protein [Aureivirga sp. CE67]|uniref:amidohydrolase family protein n=1 Tax=Aureivirga sp. CE67 TaxID=1788983 RepID=UPI0018CB0F28|nr:amidohydrolase family protein [Aureivirga sp. CE67]